MLPGSPTSKPPQTVLLARRQQSAGPLRAGPCRLHLAGLDGGRLYAACSLHAAQVLVRLLDGLSALHQAAGMHAALRWATGMLVCHVTLPAGNTSLHSCARTAESARTEWHSAAMYVFDLGCTVCHSFSMHLLL